MLHRYEIEMVPYANSTNAQVNVVTLNVRKYLQAQNVLSSLQGGNMMTETGDWSCLTGRLQHRRALSLPHRQRTCYELLHAIP